MGSEGLRMRALVTGGGGFIGHHLVRRLLTDGYEVRVLDNFATGHRQRLETMEVDVVEGDLRSYERVHTAVRGCDLVFHLGALPSVPRSVQDPLTTNAVCIDGTLNVLLASRDEGARRVVFASSSSVYGANPTIPKSEADPAQPLSPYAVAKLAGEQYCRAFHAVYGLEAVALRLFNVFGPGQDPHSQYAAVVPRFISALGRGEQPEIFGDGEQTRDFTYVLDVVDAFVRAATVADVGGTVMNVANGRELSVLELARIIADRLGVPLEPVWRPERAGEVRRSAGDATLARSVLGWEQTWSVEDALSECIGAAFQPAR
jgi:UDP-glucose 4-epimerase